MMMPDKDQKKMELSLQLRYMENFARMFGSDHAKKVEMARVSLRELQKLDPHVMTVAMTMVGCEGFMELIDKREELIVEAAKGGLKP
jgi:NADH:ubiquinone oxidoreductase subunit D